MYRVRVDLGRGMRREQLLFGPDEPDTWQHDSAQRRNFRYEQHVHSRREVSCGRDYGSMGVE
jgi:hypothetical protein